MPRDRYSHFRQTNAQKQHEDYSPLATAWLHWTSSGYLHRRKHIRGRMPLHFLGTLMRALRRKAVYAHQKLLPQFDLWRDPRANRPPQFSWGVHRSDMHRQPEHDLPRPPRARRLPSCLKDPSQQASDLDSQPRVLTWMVTKSYDPLRVV